MEAFIMMIIFSGALVVAALRLYTTKNPKDSMLMYKYHGLEKMTDEEAHAAAQMVAKGVALVALVLCIGGIVGMFNVLAGGLILIFGTLAAFVVIGKFFQIKK
ncbi:MAG: hypothetical protein IJI78_08695 [Oscillospiraceae bacterium]|nr:hypothetical protein [Oscillospiraceae bacterium]